MIKLTETIQIVVIKKNLPVGTLRQVFFCLRPRTQPHPPYILYTCRSILIHTERGMGGGELNQREG